MFGLGLSEILVILVLVLLVVGPARLPEIARGIGKGVRELRRATRDLDAVPEIRELRRAVDEIRAPVMDTLHEPVVDADPERSPVADDAAKPPGPENK